MILFDLSLTTAQSGMCGVFRLAIDAGEKKIDLSSVVVMLANKSKKKIFGMEWMNKIGLKKST